MDTKVVTETLTEMFQDDVEELISFFSKEGRVKGAQREVAEIYRTYQIFKSE